MFPWVLTVSLGVIAGCKSYACPDPAKFVCKVHKAVPQASLCIPAGP
jgi:hypothetical protein